MRSGRMRAAGKSMMHFFSLRPGSRALHPLESFCSWVREPRRYNAGPFPTWIPIAMHRFGFYIAVPLTLGSIVASLVGCGTTRSSDTTRTATEQLLISDAIDRAVQSV